MILGIPVVYDLLSSKNVNAVEVLPADANDVSLLRNQVRRERKTKSTRFVCGLCHDPIYVNNSGGNAHFSHYSDSGPSCSWHSLTASRLRDISAARFQGRQVSELHVKLVLAVEEILKRCSAASNIGQPDQTYFGS